VNTQGQSTIEARIRRMISTRTGYLRKTVSIPRHRISHQSRRLVRAAAWGSAKAPQTSTRGQEHKAGH